MRTYGFLSLLTCFRSHGENPTVPPPVSGWLVLWHLWGLHQRILTLLKMHDTSRSDTPLGVRGTQAVLLLGNCAVAVKVHQGPHRGKFCPATTTSKCHGRALGSGQRRGAGRDPMAWFLPDIQTSLRKCELPSQLKRRRTHAFHSNKIPSWFKPLTAITLMLAQCFWAYKYKELNDCMCSVITSNGKQKCQGMQKPQIKYLVGLLDTLTQFHKCH